MAELVSGTAPGLGQGTHYNDTSVVTDVTDFIFQITPEDKPFFHLCGDKAAVSAPWHEWQTRDLITRSGNAQVEGFNYTFTNPSRLPSRTGNVLHIMAKDIRISNTNQAIGHYGIPNMRADQVEVQLGELGTDIEHGLIQSTLRTSGTAGTARRMKGIIQAVISGITGFTNSTAVTFVESVFNAHLENGWGRGAALRDALVDGRMKRVISNYSGNNLRVLNADSGRLVNTVDVYESEYGPVSMHLCRDIPTINSGTTAHRNVLVVDKTHLQKAWLRGVGVERTAKIADSEDYMATCELTLEYGNPIAHLLVACLPTI